MLKILRSVYLAYVGPLNAHAVIVACPSPGDSLVLAFASASQAGSLIQLPALSTFDRKLEQASAQRQQSCMQSLLLDPGVLKSSLSQLSISTFRKAMHIPEWFSHPDGDRSCQCRCYQKRSDNKPVGEENPLLPKTSGMERLKLGCRAHTLTVHIFP